MNAHDLLPPEGSDVRIVRLRRAWGSAIKAQREGLGMTQLQLAEAVGVTNQAVASWEVGKSAPRAHLQADIAKALGVAWSVLFQPEAA